MTIRREIGTEEADEFAGKVEWVVMMWPFAFYPAYEGAEETGMIRVTVKEGAADVEVAGVDDVITGMHFELKRIGECWFVDGVKSSQMEFRVLGEHQEYDYQYALVRSPGKSSRWLADQVASGRINQGNFRERILDRLD